MFQSPIKYNLKFYFLLVIFITLPILSNSLFFFKRRNNNVANVLQSRKSPMLNFLDEIQRIMTGGGQFNRNVYNQIRSCMSSFDPNTPKAQDAAWQGIVDFWNQNGLPDDRWGAARSGYIEKNITKSNIQGMKIYEPCSVSSNIAYYHTLLEMCNRRDKGTPFSMPQRYLTRLGKTVSAMAMGSSFYHGSNTRVGYQQDVALIALIFYLIHQAGLSSLPYSSILHDLSHTPREFSSIQMADKLQDMYMNEPSSNWFKKTEEIKIPDYELIIGALLLTIIRFNFDQRTASKAASSLIPFFNPSEANLNFLLNSYLPELQKATDHIILTKMEQTRIRNNSIGVMLKFIHSLLWNEQRVISDPILLEPIVNMIGNTLLPGITRKANNLLSYEFFNPDFHRSRNVYPGEKWCNPRYPHTKWHVLSALTLLDSVYYSDDLYVLMSNTNSNNV